MDIVKPKKHKSNSQKMMMVITTIVILVMSISYAKTTLNKVQLPREGLLFSQVKQGDLDIIIEGYGKLISDKLQLITTLTRATVSEIILKPGAIVTKDSIIVKLSNPELEQIVDNAKQELAKRKANARQLKMKNYNYRSKCKLFR